MSIFVMRRGSPIGRYIWNKYTVENGGKGTLVETLRERSYDAYPLNGIYDGYWYVLQNALFDVYDIGVDTASSVTLSATYTKMVSTQSTLEDSLFTLISPASKTISSLSSGQFILDIGNNNSNIVSGSKLYRITNRTNKEFSYSGASRSPISNAEIFYFGTSFTFNSTNGSFTVSGISELAKENLVEGNVYYSIKIAGGTETSGSTLWKHTYRGISTGVNAGFASFESTEYTSYASKTQISYVPYDISNGVTLLETIVAPADTYPENGIVNDYGYKLRT